MNWYKLAKLREVELFGTLKDNKGFIYLSLPNSIIKSFMPMIDEDIVHPEEASSKWSGCHISVIHKEETEEKIKEVGEEFSFKIKGVFQTKPEGWKEVKRVYFITVDSPELEKLRQKYKLPKLYKNHEFHITVGVETF